MGETRGQIKSSKKRHSKKETLNNTFQMHPPKEAALEIAPDLHVYGADVVCKTDKRGYITPDNKSLDDLRVDATEGFIPLWAKGTTLRWRFQEQSMRRFVDPEGAKSAIRGLFSDALGEWGNASPVRFAERTDAWDFEIALTSGDDCDASGCVLASAFFPGTSQDMLWMYPKMFEQSRKGQVNTFIHEIGHIFGLRHFFANISETAWASELFGEDNEFSIMNYGSKSKLTAADKSDLTKLYQKVWSGDVTDINGTPVKLMRPFSYYAMQPVATNSIAASIQIFS